MADSFSLTTGLAGLVTLTIQLVKISHQYFLDAREAPTSIRNFIVELVNFKKVLTEFEDAILLNPNIIEAFEERGSSVLSTFSDQKEEVFDSTSSVHVEICKEELERLLVKLRKQITGSKLSIATTRLKWPLDKTSMQEAVTSLHRYRAVFTTSAVIDTLKISTDIHREVKALNRAQIDAGSEEKTRKVLSWLSPLEFHK